MADIDEQFPDYGRLLDDLAALLQRVAVLQVAGAGNVDDESRDAEPTALADALTPEDVQLFYQTAIIGRRDLHLAPDPRSGAEMTLLRMLAFRPATPAATEPKPAPSAAGRGAQSPASKAGDTRSAAPVAESKSATARWHEPDWAALLPELGLNGAARLLAGNCAFLNRSGNTVYLSLDERFASMLTRPRQETLAKALSTHFGEELKVDIAVSTDGPETPHQAENRLADESLEAARQSLESDPNVQALKSMFGAELKQDSIEVVAKPQSD